VSPSSNDYEVWKASADAEARKVFREMTKLEPRAARAYMVAVREAKGGIDVVALREALASGNLTAAEAALHLERFESTAGSVTTVFRDGFDRGAESGATAAKPLVVPGAVAIYDPLDPFIQAQLRRHTAELVSGITNTTKDGIRAVMGRAYERGMHPSATAGYIQDLVGLTKRQALAVDNLHRRLIDEGVSEVKATARVKKYSAKLHKQRAMNIARTESSRMVNAGRHSMWKKLEQDGSFGDHANRIERVWITNPDERLCEQCEPLDGEAVGLDESFPGGVMYPPLHPQCRCTVVLRLRREKAWKVGVGNLRVCRCRHHRMAA